MGRFQRRFHLKVRSTALANDFNAHAIVCQPVLQFFLGDLVGTHGKEFLHARPQDLLLLNLARRNQRPDFLHPTVARHGLHVQRINLAAQRREQRRLRLLKRDSRLRILLQNALDRVTILPANAKIVGLRVGQSCD